MVPEKHIKIVSAKHINLYYGEKFSVYTLFFLNLDPAVMKKICKSVLTVFLMAMSAMFSACVVDSEEKIPNVYPNNGLRFRLFPNDAAVNDSASANLSHGLIFMVHPNATYELSFDADTSFAEAPLLQLYRTKPVEGDGNYLNLYKVKNVSGKLEEGRYVYKFLCEKSVSETWALTLVQHGTYYEGTTNNVRLKGDGAYSDRMSLNLIVVGNVAAKIKGFTIDELAEDLLASFREIYSSIKIDTLYVNYANEHPTLGSKYPANEPWYAGWSSKDKMVSELGGWPGIENALDMVLVDYIIDEDVLGYSNLFSGNMGGGAGSTVVLGAFVKGATSVRSLEKNEIVTTAIHETGHFFGLRHTTTASGDVFEGGDLSNKEDGFEDTPFCEQLWLSPLFKKRSDLNVGDWTMSRIKISAAERLYDFRKCPDASNVMFPYDTESEYNGFSEQQLDFIRATLTIYPH